MDYPKFIVSNQKKESIGIQRVKPFCALDTHKPIHLKTAKTQMKYTPNSLFLSPYHWCK